MIISTKRLSPPKMMPDHYPGVVTVSSIRWWIFNEKTNGFSCCVRRIGKKILIDLDEFEKWIDQHKENVSKGGTKMKNSIKNPALGKSNLGSKKANKKKYDINLSAQRARLLSWLREKPITTIEARHHLDILAPAPRIFELRHQQNYNIKTHWCDEITEQGIRHRVARYMLHPGNYKEVE